MMGCMEQRFHGGAAQDGRAGPRPAEVIDIGARLRAMW